MKITKETCDGTMIYVWKNNVLTFEFLHKKRPVDNVKITVEGCSDITEAKQALHFAYRG